MTFSLQGPIAIRMAKLAINQGIEVSLAGSPSDTEMEAGTFSASAFALFQVDLSTGLAIEEACYAQVRALLFGWSGSSKCCLRFQMTFRLIQSEKVFFQRNE